MAAARRQRKSGTPPAELSEVLAASPAAGTTEREEIARAAYLLWERDGQPQGRDEQYWLEAEAQIRAGKKKTARGG